MKHSGRKSHRKQSQNHQSGSLAFNALQKGGFARFSSEGEKIIAKEIEGAHRY
jgi:hypothetical protein